MPIAGGLAATCDRATVLSHQQHCWPCTSTISGADAMDLPILRHRWLLPVARAKVLGHKTAAGLTPLQRQLDP